MKISIEGIPGSGKTTILKILQEMGYNCYVDGEHTFSDHRVAETMGTSIKIIETSPYVLERLLAVLAPAYQHKKKGLWLHDWTPNFIIFLDCTPDIAVKRLTSAGSHNQALSTTPSPALGSQKIALSTTSSPALGSQDVTNIDNEKEANSDNGIELSALQITKLYLELEWILHSVNCAIPIYRVNASGSVIQTLHTVLAVLQLIRSRLA
jgi:hypothetical protein